MLSFCVCVCVCMCVYVYHLTKYTRLILYFIGEDLLTVKQVVLLFFQNVVKYCGIPIILIYDKSPRFISDFWKSLWKLLGSHAIVRPTYHPQADGRTEYINHTIG